MSNFIKERIEKSKAKSQRNVFTMFFVRVSILSALILFLLVKPLADVDFPYRNYVMAGAIVGLLMLLIPIGMRIWDGNRLWLINRATGYFFFSGNINHRAGLNSTKTDTVEDKSGRLRTVKMPLTREKSPKIKKGNLWLSVLVGDAEFGEDRYPEKFGKLARQLGGYFKKWKRPKNGNSDWVWVIISKEEF